MNLTICKIIPSVPLCLKENKSEGSWGKDSHLNSHHFLNHPSPLRQRVLKCRFGSYYYRSIYISLYSIWFIFPRDHKNVNVEVYQVFKRPMLSDDQESLNNQELPVSCSVICYEILTLKSHFPCFCETLQWCSGAVLHEQEELWRCKNHFYKQPLLNRKYSFILWICTPNSQWKDTLYSSTMYVVSAFSPYASSFLHWSRG